MAIATGFGWELSYLVPVLSLSFLSSADKPLNVKSGLAFIGIVGIAAYLGWTLGNRVIPYPLVYVPLVGLILFRLFYAGRLGRSKLLVMWLLLAITIIPLVRLLQPSIALFVAQGIFKNVLVTVGIAVAAFALMPEPAYSASDPPPHKPTPPVPTRGEAFRGAMLATAVVLPLLTLFYLFRFTGAVLILVFVAILSSQPAFSANFKVGKALIIGNVIGGIISIVFYEVLVMAPVFILMLMMTFSIGLILGWRVFSGKPVSAVFGLAYSTVLLIIGSTTTSTSDAGTEVYSRVLQITIAVVYVVIAFGLLNRLFPAREDA
jgi:hypothetical protein